MDMLYLHNDIFLTDNIVYDRVKYRLPKNEILGMPLAFRSPQQLQASAVSVHTFAIHFQWTFLVNYYFSCRPVYEMSIRIGQLVVISLQQQQQQQQQQ